MCMQTQPRICQEKKGCLSSLFVLVWLVWMRCLGAYAQRDFQASWRECTTLSALLTASGVACEEVGVAEMEFFGLKCTLKVNTALRRKLPL